MENKYQRLVRESSNCNRKGRRIRCAGNQNMLQIQLTSLPSGFLITTPSTTGDFLASACAYSGPTVYTYNHCKINSSNHFQKQKAYKLLETELKFRLILIYVNFRYDQRLAIQSLFFLPTPQDKKNPDIVFEEVTAVQKNNFHQTDIKIIFMLSKGQSPRKACASICL